MMQIKLPQPQLAFIEQEDDILLAMLVFGEARGESREAKIGVAHVAKNRADNPRWWGKTLKTVILKPYQFSCFLPNDPNAGKLLLPLKYESAETWDECFEVATGVMAGEIPDNTQTSDSYFDDSIRPPRWAEERHKTVKIGRLNFYRIELSPKE